MRVFAAQKQVSLTCVLNLIRWRRLSHKKYSKFSKTIPRSVWQSCLVRSLRIPERRIAISIRRIRFFALQKSHSRGAKACMDPDLISARTRLDDFREFAGIIALRLQSG